MKRIALATVATLAFAGVAAAQEAPVLQGNYDAAVLNSHESRLLDNGAAATGAHAISTKRLTVTSQPGGYGPQIADYEIRSGR